MHGQQPLNCFYLNDYRVVDEHVQAVALIQLKSVVEHGHDLLLDHGLPGGPELIRETRVVDGFEQPWTKF